MNKFDLFCGILTIYFGFRTLLQQHLANQMRDDAGYFAQSIYNNFFQIGSTAEKGLKSTSSEAFRESLMAVASSTQTARHHVIQFGKNVAHITPFFEPAWEPKQMVDRRTTALEYLFLLGK